MDRSGPGNDAIFAALPAIGEAMAVKMVTLDHDNAQRGLPTHQGSRPAQLGL